MTTDWEYIGVDVDGSDWIAVGIGEANSVRAAAYEHIADLWEDLGSPAERIVVDIPIGLCDSRDAEEPHGKLSGGELSRHCDDLARKIIGPRSSSVFPAPCREAAERAADGADYSEVTELNEERTGKGLTQQAKGIAPNIIEVDELLDTSADAGTLVEGHPELSFRAFSDTDLSHSKRTAPGVLERMELLETRDEFGSDTWRDLTRALEKEGHETGLDDLLDAMALACTACAPESEWQTLPEDPPTDAEQRPMQMVYRRPEPFEVESSGV